MLFLQGFYSFRIYHRITINISTPTHYSYLIHLISKKYVSTPGFIRRLDTIFKKKLMQAHLLLLKSQAKILQGDHMDTKRLSALDGLRGIAAIVVACFHYFYHYHHEYGHSFNAPEWLKLGYFGVHLFFLVSGFVIFWTLSRSDTAPTFIWSRFSRLFPVYWVAVTLTFIVITAIGPVDRHVSISNLMVNYTMLQGYLGLPHVDGVYWTLTLELSFYFWMLILLLLRQLQRIEYWLLGWIGIAILIEVSGLNEILPRRVKFIFLLDYIGLFAAGICFYRIKSGSGNRLSYAVIAASITSAFVAYPVKFAVLITGWHLLFYLAVSGRLNLLASKPFVFMGTISYSFYLIHQNIGYTIINWGYQLKVFPFISIAIAFALTISLAIALTFLIEKPAMKYLRKLDWASIAAQKIRDKVSLRSSR